MRRSVLSPASLALAALIAAPVAAFAQSDAPVVAETMDAPHFVTWASAAVRVAPDGSSDRVSTLSFGDSLFVTGLMEGGEWVQVELEDGTRGYMWADLLAPMRMLMPGGDSTPSPIGGDGLVASDDNSFELATEIVVDSMGFVTGGSVGAHDAGDFYSFEVFEWTDLVIDLYDLSADVDLALYDEEQLFLADSVMGGSDAEFISLPIAPGRYYVEVYSFEGDTTYELSIYGTPGEEPPPDQAGSTRDEAFDLGVLMPNQSLIHEDWVGAGDATDYVSFVLEEPTDVVVEVYGLSSDVDMSVEDDFGSILGSSAFGGSEPEIVELTLDPGTYYVSMIPFSGSSSYTVEIYGTEATPAPVDNAGNSFDDANDLGLLSTEVAIISDWVGTRDTDDYYRFEIDVETNVTLALSSLADDADLRLYAENGERFIASSELGGTEDELITQVLQPGIYHLQVSIFGQETEYTLEVSRAAG